MQSVYDMNRAMQSMIRKNCDQIEVMRQQMLTLEKQVAQLNAQLTNNYRTYTDR